MSAGRETQGRSLSRQAPTGVGEISLGLALVAIFTVLAFGGRYSLAIFIMQTSICALGIFTLWRFGWPAVPRAALAVLGILLVIPLVQMLPLWEEIVAALSPARVAIARDVLSPVVSPSKFLTLSVNPYATSAATLNLVCYGLVFLLAFYVCIHRRRQPALVAVLIVVGCLEAVYGIIQYLTGWQYIFTYAKRLHASDATGTYINRNHFAGLLEMVLPFVLAGILFRSPAPGTPGRPRWVQVLLSPAASRSLRDVIVFAVVCVALIFSRSRMGIAAALVGVAVVVTIALLQNTRRAALPLILLVLALPATYAVWIGVAPVLERFELGLQVGLEQYRLPVWRDTLALIHDYPLLGAGLGAYQWATVPYQSSLFELRYVYAHNDYLQFAAGIGVPATVLLFGSLWILAVKVARRAMVLERTSDKVLAAGCAGAMASLLTHSVTDFNLQVPANAFLFAWIVGTAVALVQPAPQAQARA